MLRWAGKVLAQGLFGSLYHLLYQSTGQAKANGMKTPMIMVFAIQGWRAGEWAFAGSASAPVFDALDEVQCTSLITWPSPYLETTNTNFLYHY